MEAFRNIELPENVTQEHIQHAWQHLDDLARNDPKGYQENFKSILNNHKKMEESARIVEPGIAVFATGTLANGSNVHILNIGRSRAVPVETDPTNVPVVMSNPRVYVNMKGSVSNVYDAVFSYQVIDKCKTNESYRKDVLNLAVSCVKETFNFDLDTASFQMKHDTYFGPYGWNDKTGKPIETSDSSQNHETDFSKFNVLSSPSDYLKQTVDKDVSEAAEHVSIPGISMGCNPAFQKVPFITTVELADQPKKQASTARSDQTSLTKPKVLIQELTDGVANTTLGAEPTPLIQEIVKPIVSRPKCAIKDADTFLDIVILLPEIRSSTDIVYVLHERKLILDTRSDRNYATIYHLELNLPTQIQPHTETSKFHTVRRQLVIRVEKCSTLIFQDSSNGIPTDLSN
ncbi:hypothetical protein MT418_003281 [Batrachochytrium dendrobatidis]